MKKNILYTIGTLVLIVIFSNTIMAQQKNQMVRLAKIQVYPAQLDQYNAALKEQMAAAIKLEPGVLTYYAVAEKDNPHTSPFLKYMPIQPPIKRI